MILPPKVIHPTGESEISALIADTFNRRSIAENTLYRLKQLFGDSLASRLFDSDCVT